MKDVAIDTGAAWVATYKTWQDGDVFRESNTDVIWDALGDRLGYLKTQVDLRATLAGTNTWTAANTFQSDVTVEGDLNTTSAINGAGGTFTDIMNFSAISLAPTTLTDVDTTISGTFYEFRVPAITGNRIYTLPSTTGLVDGHRIQIVRMRTADAFTVTLKDPTGPTTLGIISASLQGFIEATKKGSSWVVSQWGGTVTSLLTTV